MANKKYVSLNKLSTFLDNLKNTFASLTHKHTISDITDYKVDSSLSPTSTNPVQNKVLDAEFEAMATAMNALDSAIDGKADASHNHDSKYDAYGASDAKLEEAKSYTDTNIEELSEGFGNVIYQMYGDDITENGAPTIRQIANDEANTALDSAKGYTDSVASGKANVNHNHDSAYDAKGSANNALTSAKTYADSAANKVKDDLLNGAGGAYDTLKELGDLISDNQDAIDALETVASNKADKTHSHAIADVSGLQSALDGKAATSHGTHVSYSTTAPVMDGTASVGSASTVARSDHKHPTDTSRASKTEFDTHTSNTTVHITSTERSNWNAAKTHADSAHAPSNAEKNQNAFSNIKVGSTTIAADTTTDTLELVGSNVTITPDATSDKVTISVADGSTSAKGVVKLTNSTSSTSTTTAATPNSVKSAYDLANTAKTNAATAQTKADSAYTLAESKVDSLSDLGITATATELNYVDGVTSGVQTQLDGKQAKVTGAATTITGSNLTVNRALISNGSGKVAVSAVTSTELGYLDGVTSNVQTQLDAIKNAKADWNQNDSAQLDFIENRPFYTTDPVDTVIVEGTIPANGMLQTSASINSLTLGETYNVVFDGTAYNNLVCENYDGLPSIGNDAFMFAIQSGRAMAYAANGSASHTIKVMALLSSIVPLERKYIAEHIDNLAGEKVAGKAYTVDGAQVTAGEGAEVFNDYSTNIASGQYSHAEGMNNIASGSTSHAEGWSTVASGSYSHTEGYETTASGSRSHAEGWTTEATAQAAHAEGFATHATGQYSHAEGDNATASGRASHAEGYGTKAIADYSHAEGMNTNASSEYQHVQGKYNVIDENDTYAHIVGNGTSNSSRKNAHTIDWKGNGWFAGDIKIGGTGYNDSAAVGIVPASRTVNGKALSSNISLTASDVGAAATSHGNHVPATQTANSATFLRNDNTWQKVTPANIGAAASSHEHSYLPLSGGTVTGHIKTGAKGLGYYLTDGAGFSYPGILDNGTNLWIGTTSSAAQHHKGLTLISSGHNGTTGNETIKIAVPNNANTGNKGSYDVLHSGNYYKYAAKASHTHSYLPLSGGTLTGNLVVEDKIECSSKDMHVASSKGSVYLENKDGSMVRWFNYNGTNYNNIFRSEGTDAILGSETFPWYRIFCATSTLSTSDEREKSDITPISDYPVMYTRGAEGNVFEQLFYKLNPVTYTLNIEKTNDLHIGFIAQDIEEAANEIGMPVEDLGFVFHESWIDEETGEEKDRYSLGYEEFIALNTYMIQKQKAKIEEQQSMIDSLEERIVKLEKLIDNNN